MCRKKEIKTKTIKEEIKTYVQDKWCVLFCLLPGDTFIDGYKFDIDDQRRQIISNLDDVSVLKIAALEKVLISLPSLL